MESLENNNKDQVGEKLNQKLDDIIEDSRTKSSALKKILKGLENLNDKPKNGKPRK